MLAATASTAFTALAELLLIEKAVDLLAYSTVILISSNFTLESI
jgi:hypothetical protein